ncbi:FHA domain-containing protein [Microbacterium dauci]|uniref:FHA domain-containing protein n=1 Tax=Microbacterium dauci TaxID=3048008 RepID=A0ABT6ZAW8_9MICO|nr:FHA domain-containing protein [Microbacterium sp. LX3-4]MDJ1113305.1 FHA domain-containing protein [Microbacterium sp. LX3-4]
MFRYPTPQDPAHSGYAIAGDRFALLVAAGIDERLLAGLWDAAADPASLLEDVLSVLVAEGIHTLPDFALAEFAPGSPARVRVAVRGAATAEDGAGRAVEGRDARTWTETSLDDVDGLRLRLGDPSEGAGALPLGLGVVRTNELAWGKPVAGAAVTAAAGEAADAAPAAAPPAEPTTPPTPTPVPPQAQPAAPAPAAPPLPRIPTVAPAASLDESDVLETLFIDRSLFARPIDDEKLELPAFLTDETGDIELPDERTLLGGRRASAAPTPSATYVLRVHPGRDLPLDRPVVLGRGPRPARHPGARIEVVPSPAKEISGAHLEVRLDGDHLVAHDLDSTNGTIVRPRESDPLLLRGGATLRVPADTLFDLGDGVTARFQIES